MPARRWSFPISLFCLALVLPGSAVAGGRAEYAFLQYPVEKIRPGDMPAARASVTVRCAGNEYESVVIGFRNPSAASLEVSGIRVSRREPAPALLNLYRIDYVPVTAPSRWFSGTKGPWPDPLIPITAQGAGGGPDEGGDGGVDMRWAFERSVVVPPGENRSFLLEVYLPPGDRASEELAVSLSLSDGRTYPLVVRVQPWSFDLPRESSLATAFGFSAGLVAGKHAELSTIPFSGADLALEYLHILGRYKVSVGFPHEPSPAAVNGDGSLSFDWSGFDELTGRALDGTLFPDAPPSTSFQVPASPPGLSIEQSTAYLREVAAHVREKGWLGRMFYYLHDEPLRSEYPSVRAVAERVRDADPDIRTLVTEPYTPDLQGSVSIWCPDIPFIGDSLPFMPVAARWPYKLYFDWQSNPPPSRYAARRAEGEQAWLYTCNSAVFLDYPNLFIDTGASANRIIPWLAFRHGFTGLLYWHSVVSYGMAGSPWGSPLVMLANGDGNLLYPGVPGQPDIRTHRPIPSLRLQILRDGLEDYEYLELASRALGMNEARDAAARVASSSLCWVHDGAAMERIREEIGMRIERSIMDGR